MSREQRTSNNLGQTLTLQGRSSWKWGAGTASGKVADIVHDGKTEVTSNKVSVYQARPAVNEIIDCRACRETQ